VATTFDVLFLGAGPGGYVGAIRAAQLGLSAGVVEKDKPGGVCVNIGCIPTKALLHSAEVANLLRHAKDLGVTTGEVSTDYGVAMKRSRRVAEQNSKGVEYLFKKHKIELIRGTGTLLPGRKIAVTPVEGAPVELAATKAVVVATGSRPKDLPQLGLKIDRTTMISSDEALLLDAAPRSIAIVGAGAVGCEFADIFNAFGAQVTLLEVLPRILPVEDGEMSEVVAKAFRKRGITVHAGAQIQKAAVEKDGATIAFTAAGKAETLKVEKILIATGRAPNTEGIGLEAAGVKLSDRGFVQVGPTMQSTSQGVYAIGDVAGPPLLAHKGSREGVVAAEAIAGAHPHPIDYTGVPGATYCHPEVASIGLTEETCKEQKLEYVVGRFPFSASGRARTTGETDGLVKIIRGKKYGEILGAHIAGAHATELVHELAVARANEYTVEEIELAIHAHPTLSEAVAEAALDAMGRAIHI
jgi:dihydrolipoamide dehydrogenase